MVKSKGDAFRFRIVGIGSLSEEQIQRHFARYGEVLGIEFARDPFTEKLTGNGSVRIEGSKESSKKQIFEDRHEIAGSVVSISDDYERKIFIGGFKDTDPDIVRDYFKTFGEVEEFDVAFREKNGRPRGYAFLRFVNAASMDSAMASETHTIDGRECVVKRAEARPFIDRKDKPLVKKVRRAAVRRSCSRSYSRSRSRSQDGRRRGSRGGLQIAPGYSYEDGIGARPAWPHMPVHGPPHYGHGWPPPPHTGYSYPPAPAYGGYGPYVDYGRPPPGHGPPPGYGSHPYGGPPPDAYGRPPPDAYGGPPINAYGVPAYQQAPPSAYRQPPPGYAYGTPPPDYGQPRASGGYGPPPGY